MKAQMKTAAIILLGFFIVCVNVNQSEAEAHAERFAAQRHLIEDIIAERKLILSFNFQQPERTVLVAMNRNLRAPESGEKNERAVGVVILTPSGILRTLVIDSRLSVIHRASSIPRRNFREELARDGILISEARMIARSAEDGNGTQAVGSGR